MSIEATKDSLRQRGVRLTRQRKILLDLIDASSEHLDAEQLYQLAREKDPKLNRVTVYRTLKLLKAGGLVDELDLMHHKGDQHYYETRLKQEHAHIICLRCGRIEEYFGAPLQNMREQIETQFGFQIMIARTEVGGYCAHCRIVRAQEMSEAAKSAQGPDGGPLLATGTQQNSRIETTSRPSEGASRRGGAPHTPGSVVRGFVKR